MVAMTASKRGLGRIFASLLAISERRASGISSQGHQNETKTITYEAFAPESDILNPPCKMKMLMNAVLFCILQDENRFLQDTCKMI